MNMFRPEPSVSGMRFSSHAYSIQNDESLHIQTVAKALLYRRFLSQQLGAIFVALKLQLQNRRCKPGAICRRDIAGVSNMFET